MANLHVFLPLILLAAGLSAAASPPVSGYKLVWADEFERDGRPDPERWVFEKGFERNEELQWYQPDNAFCSNGVLVIEACRERRPNPLFKPDGQNWRNKRPDIEYTSSSLTTKGRQSWQFGRFEMRARIDTRAGLWPAFWMLGTRGRWPGCGEVDILEYYRGTLLANVVWATDRQLTQKWATRRKRLTEFADPHWSEKFHVWRMDWEADAIRLYVDDDLLNTVDLKDAVNRDDGRCPFHQPHYLLLNLAVGGQQGGDPSATQFPARFVIDYVRVYQKTP